MLKTKTSAFFSLLLVFLSGALVGGVADRLYNTTAVVTPATKRPDPEEVRKQIIAEMRKEVKVDDQQVNQLNQIYDTTQDQFMQFRKKQSAEVREIWDSQRSQIRAILRPDQVPLFEALTAKHDAEREAAKKKKQQDHHKGGPEGAPPPTPGK